MKSFRYRAYTADGTKRTGLIVAEHRTDAAEQLRKDGLFPEEIDLQSDSGGTGINSPSRSLFRRARRLDNDLQAVFARQMAVLLSAGLPVDDALAAIGSSGGVGVMDQVVSRLRALVREGAPLSEALAKGNSGFAQYVVSAIRAGETSGDLAAVFSSIADYLETRRTDRTALATALIYPAFVGSVSLLVCGILMTTVAPELARMFETTGRPLPPLTAFMLAVTGWIGRNAVLLAVFFVAAGTGVTMLLRRPRYRDRWDAFLLRLPVVGRLIMLDAAQQYLRTLALVIGSRQPVVDGVRNASDVLSVRQFRDESAHVTEAINAGDPLSRALQRTTFIPEVARQLVEAGEKSARIAQMTQRAAVLVETWLVNDRRRLAALIDPILMMLIGVFVLIVVLSVLLPIFDMQSAIKL